MILHQSLATLIITIIFLLGFGCDKIYGKENCEDCMPFTRCPEAVNLVNNDKSDVSRQRVKDAFCGFKYRRGQKTIQVCCSQFDNILTDGSNEENQSDAIEMHPNVNLLPKLCENLDDKRIINGRVAAMYELPYMVLLSYNTGNGLQFMCGGSIINSRYVLTAAHCIKRNRLAGVRVGEFDIRYQTDCDADLVCESHLQDITIEKIIVHENYKHSLVAVENDIALLRLHKEIDFSYRNAAPVCLPIASELRKPLRNGEMGLVSGWGVTETQAASPLLMKVSIPVITNVTCHGFYNKNLKPGQEYRLVNEFCAGELNKDSCSGDSGGPFVIERPFNYITSYFQYGIVSRGPRQCGSKNPGIYTSVMDHMLWILDNIKP